ncbi:MAG: magnesium/cobalt transporter CorA [Chloroflexota bacterium]
MRMARRVIEPSGEQDNSTAARIESNAIVGIAGRGSHDANGNERGHVSESARSVLDVEGSAAEEATARDKQGHGVAWLYRRDQSPCQVDFSQLEELVAVDENFVWIDLSGYEEEDLHRLAQILDLHRISVHSALSPWRRPRLDVFRNSFFMSATVARLDSQAFRVHASQLDLFLGQNYLISAHKLPLPFIDGVMARTYQNPDLVRHDSAFMLYIVLDELIEYYESLHEEVQDQIEKMEQRALTDASDDFLKDLIELKRFAFALRQLAEQHRNIFEAFLRPDFPYLSGDGVDVYFRDLDARLSRLLDELAAGREAVNGAFDIYVSHVSHRTNHIIKILTMVSTVLLPNWLILSFFSTGFHNVVPNIYTQSGFVVMVAGMIVVTVAVLYAFRRQQWI